MSFCLCFNLKEVIPFFISFLALSQSILFSILIFTLPIYCRTSARFLFDLQYVTYCQCSGVNKSVYLSSNNSFAQFFHIHAFSFFPSSCYIYFWICLMLFLIRSQLSSFSLWYTSHTHIFVFGDWFIKFRKQQFTRASLLYKLYFRRILTSVSPQFYI